MRKRIVIGLIAAVTIGVGVYVVSELSGPKERSVEYHKAEYLKALYGDTLKDRFNNLLRSWGVKAPDSGWPKSPSKRALRHETALLRLGYLERREFVLSNRFSSGGLIWQGGSAPVYVRFEEPRTNILVLVAPRDEMSIWRKMVPGTDVTKNRK